MRARRERLAEARGCLPLYGSDMDEATNPLEADLGWVISKDKQSYVGWPKLSSFMHKAPAKVRRGIVMDERIPRRDFKVTDQAGAQIGVVTSGTFSPMLKRGIAMAYVKTVSSGPGEPVKGGRQGRPERREDHEVPLLRRLVIMDGSESPTNNSK